MSLITRCTACQTLFKVVPDQLRISDGWVRCGQCGEIFDAAQHLLVGQEDEPISTQPVESETLPVEHESTTEEPAAVAAAQAAERLVESAKGSEPPVDATQGIGPHVESASAAPDGGRAEDGATAADTAVPESTATEALPGDTPSFMRASSAPTAWQRRGVRRALALLLLVLVGALSVQVLRHERDRIASIEPGLRPLLVALCEWTRCSVAPMRQIESVVIDSSSFSRLRGDVYRLAFSLRNSGAVDIAMPAIELSITDSQDQALARRVLLPAEFGASTPVLGAGSEWGNRLSLNVKAGSGERVAGYRLLAFYP